ncbi:MAG TPA: histidine kinase, partial [Jatrophihabitans sp.]
AAQFTDDVHAVARTSTAIVVATVAGLAAVLVAPRGLGEVPAFVVAGRIPFPIDTRAGRAFVATVTVAVAVVVGYVSRTLVGGLAGLGIPLLAQRAAERRELIASRDEAQALLLEVQAGRDAEAQAAALQERGRIARELHDVLAHSLAGLSVQLQATRAVAAREGVGPAVLEPIDRAAALARDGLGEARAVVGALRDPQGLGLADLPALVDRHPGSASLRVTGEPVDVPVAAGHAVYRAVQEALTNAARYAPGAPVSVEVDFTGTGLTICVADDGLPPGRAPVPSQGSGLGLAGMSERLAAVGASVTAGPRPSGGWQVRIQVPPPVPA